MRTANRNRRSCPPSSCAALVMAVVLAIVGTAVGAPGTSVYVYDAANQLTEIRQGTRTGPLIGALVYDRNGNVTWICEGAVTTSGDTCTGTTVTGLTYDALHRLVAVAKTGLPLETYAYDADGRRVQKTVGGVVTNYVYDGEDVHATYDASWGTPAAVYTHGPNTDDPILRTSAGETRYFHQDGLGSVVALTDAGGAITATSRYDAWGNVTAATGPRSIYGYTGREPDATGLVYYRARYYDPRTGRFTQRDPIGLAGGLSLYGYAQQNPINRADPSGLETVLMAGRSISGSRDTQWTDPNSDFARMVKTVFRDPDVTSVSWRGGEPYGVTRSDITNAARSLADVVNRIPLDHPARIVVHSDGGNVAALASPMFARPVDLVVTMGTPVRSDIEFDMSRIRMGISISSTHDPFQEWGGGQLWVPFIGNIGRATTDRAGFTNVTSDVLRRHSFWEQQEDVGDILRLHVPAIQGNSSSSTFLSGSSNQLSFSPAYSGASPVDGILILKSK